MKYLLRLALIFVFSTATHAQCFQIESILVDACGAQEGLNEMVRFRVGATAINTSNMSVAWPNNGWQGLVQNATTAAKVATLNADILAAGGCGQIIQPTGGVLPANATVILVTSFNMDPSLNQFGPITGNIYILFQNNATNANGHFANYGTGTRTLAISFGACNDSVTYDRSLLVDQSGSSGAADGATVLFTPAGQATYINNGCQAPVPPFTVEAGNPVSGCAGSTVTLSGSAQGQTSVLWTAPSGTFANSANAATTYTISPTATGTITLTLTATNACGTSISDTVNVTVTNPTTPNFPTTQTYCTGATIPALATTSPNGISGTWSPSTVSNTASGSYVFTPTAGQCATSVTLNVTITNSITPNFPTSQTYCTGATIPALATTSPNGITGTWSPSTVNNTASGSYVFTPNPNQCATSVTLNVTITNSITPDFATSQTYCSGATVPALATTSPNGITGTWSPSTINNTTSGSYVFTPNAGQCATSVTLNVTITNPVTPNFPTTQTYCSGATVPALATTSPNGITGTWSPSTINNTTSGSYVFTPNTGQCATSVTLNVTINPTVIPNFATTQTYCSGATVPALAATSPNGISGTWSPSTINNTTSGSYVFTPNAGQCATSVTLNVTITNSITPDFATSQTYCSGATVPALATTSPNGITGTWSPSTINNTASGSYVFTPNAGQCATSVTLNVTITNPVTPNFPTTQTYCSGATVPALATTSPNGITGTWSPSTINNTTSGSYVFTPNTGQCATSVTLNVTINPTVIPNFATTQTYCSGATVPALAATSPNGITGTWSPSTVNNTTSGNYVFTPNTGQCATSVTLNVTINPTVIPNFATTQTYCSGATVPALATTSPNGVSGTWSPSTINNTTSGSYVFTPNAGQCATSVTLNVTITNPVTPNFPTTQTYCSGATVPALATTSPNGITGTWSPSTVNNTTSGSYVFTPNAGQCATSITLNVTINPTVIPNFATAQTYCSGATIPALATTSPNGVTGTWSPSTINNTTSGNYVFTPNTGQCATSVTLNVTINPTVIPNFATAQTYCSGAAVPALATTSPNGISGTWSPSTINNTASGSYVFTPNAGQCATSVTLNVTITNPVTPNFPTSQTYCSGATIPALATTSPNGITGTWSPSTVSNTASGNYVFTPNAGQCATSTTLNVTINPTIVPDFPTALTICAGDSVPTLSTASPNGVAGTWSPGAVNNMQSATYMFTPTAGQCAQPVNFVVTVSALPNPVLTDGTICAANGSPTTSYLLDTGLSASTYTFVWTLGTQTLATTGPSHSAVLPGTYMVTATDNATGCSNSATATVTQVGEISVTATTPVDFSSHNNIVVTVTGGSGQFAYLLDGQQLQTTNVFYNVPAGDHTIQVTDEKGCGVATVDVSFLDYPHFFTPNGDGFNDYWNIKGLSGQADARIMIFDRYGKLIKQIKPSDTSGWDGTYTGRELPSTDYWFVLEYHDRQGGAKEFKAHFSLKR